MRRLSLLLACTFVAAACSAVACQGKQQSKKKEAASAQTPQEVAQAAVRELAGPAYQQWAKANPNRPCPSIDELVKFAPKLATDPWGHPYRARCSEAALAGTVSEVMIHSLGPDGLTNTKDDVKSK